VKILARAGIVEKPEGYPWSSYKAYIGKIKRPERLEPRWFLPRFGRKKEKRKNNAGYSWKQWIPNSLKILKKIRSLIVNI